MIYLNENDLINKSFTLKQLESFDPQINSFTQFNEELFLIVAKKFRFDVIDN